MREGDWGDKGDTQTPKRAGYEYLLAYKVTVPIYDYTVLFSERWVDRFSRTRDQMVQAARSGMANVLEGYKQESLAGYIKLTGVARGSLEELLRDYHAYARQHSFEVWDKSRGREIREVGEIWAVLQAPFLPNNPNFPPLPSDPETATNLLITLINQALYLQDKLIESLKEKHMKEGGFTENLHKKRVEYRSAQQRSSR